MFFPLKLLNQNLDLIKSKIMMIQKGGCIYIISNKTREIFYVGVTSDLKQRIWQHKNDIYPKSFSAKYKCNILLYYEVFSTIVEAIAREKQLKAGSRKVKQDLVMALNPTLKDLWEEVQY